MNEKKIYYINDSEDYVSIKEGFLIKIFKDKNDFKIATIRENVDKYRPYHFHDIPLYNVKVYKSDEEDEIYFLNDISERIHERLEDLWCELEDVNEE